MAFVNFTASVPTARNKIGWLLFTLLLTQFSSFGQTTRKYLVLLRDKTGTPYSISRPEQFLSQRAIQRRQKQNIAVGERDLPVSPAYVAQIRQTGATVWYSSRWFNAVLVDATEATIAAVQQLPFVKGLEFGRSLTGARVGAVRTEPAGQRKFGQVGPLNYGISQSQIAQLGVDAMHQQGYHGEGMLIGVLDSGFEKANQVGFLKPVFDEGRVLATYDFVQKEASVYEDDSHGLSCLSAIAATADGQLYGTAYKAQFILLRTEDAATETRVEEANWLFGAEYADSAGVDVISSSLGYTEFDDPTTNYTYQNLDGKTALSTRAAQIATETGIVIVVAAGNEGADAWRYLGAPADAVSVLAIGAVNQAGQRAAFSSLGPSADGRVKPDLAARGQGTIVGSPGGQVVPGNGTSFATPLVAGLAAGFWQANPTLTAAQITDALRRSGSQYATPDAQLGYGIPSFQRQATVLATQEPVSPLWLYPNPLTDAEPLAVQWNDRPRNAVLNVTLTDLAGRVFWQHQYAPGGTTEFTLPNLRLSSGFYVITLVAGDQKRTMKVVKR